MLISSAKLLCLCSNTRATKLWGINVHTVSRVKPCIGVYASSQTVRRSSSRKAGDDEAAKIMPATYTTSRAATIEPIIRVWLSRTQKYKTKTNRKAKGWLKCHPTSLRIDIVTAVSGLKPFDLRACSHELCVVHDRATFSSGTDVMASQLAVHTHPDRRGSSRTSSHQALNVFAESSCKEVVTLVFPVRCSTMSTLSNVQFAGALPTTPRRAPALRCPAAEATADILGMWHSQHFIPASRALAFTSCNEFCS